MHMIVYKRSQIRRFFVMCAAALFITGCQTDTTPTQSEVSQLLEQPPPTFKIQDALIPMGSSTGVYYEIFVRSFADSNGDGIGDLKGVISKLDYLEDLGIKGIWLMPINPSPSYHGYDVTDYYAIHPEYGTMDDMKQLVSEAHKRGIQIIMDLVINHTSKEHPWFVESAKGAGQPKRDWYMWAEDLQLDSGTQGAWGQQAWHKLGNAHYLGVFWDGMPDLNMDNPEVRAELKRISQFWLDLGLDGFRLDAAKHVYEDFQNTGSTPKVIEANRKWWQEFREGVDEIKPGAYLVGEVWDSPAIIGPYLDRSFQSAFNFDIAGRIISMIQSGRDSDLGSMMSRIYTFYSKSSNGRFVDAPFLTNHDQDRVMTKLGGDVAKAKLAASVLLTLPGNPFMYYGEEIGMLGAKPDEHIREPILWSSVANTPPNTYWRSSLSNPATIPVDKQISDPSSLLNHYKKLIALRNNDTVLQQGGIQSYVSGVPEIAGYVRATKEDTRLVLHNLSPTSQTLKLQADAATAFRELNFSSEAGAMLTDGSVSLPPFSTVVLQP